MTTKFLVFTEDNPIVIVNSKADAEEFILSLCEEQAYEDFCEDIRRTEDTMEDYLANCIATLEDINEYRRRFPSWMVPFTTLNGYILSFYGENYYIATDVKELI